MLLCRGLYDDVHVCDKLRVGGFEMAMHMFGCQGKGGGLDLEGRIRG